MARDLPNVRFEGLLGGEGWPGCSTGPARWSCRRFSPKHSATSCWRRSRSGRRSSCTGGAVRLTRRESRAAAGLGYETDAELLTAMPRLVTRRPARRAGRGRLRRRIGEGGPRDRTHLDRYFDADRRDPGLDGSRRSLTPGPAAAGARPGAEPAESITHGTARTI